MMEKFVLYEDCPSLLTRSWPVIFALALAIWIFDTQDNTGYCEIFLRRVQPCLLYYKKKITFIDI